MSNLVILSGCFTGMTRVKLGDELLGVSRGIFYSGVPSMILSLWETQQDASIEFIKNFFRELSNGTPKVFAFNNAQKQLINSSKYNELKYWAPFILLGDWL